MIHLVIPGRPPLEIHYLVCDINGTLAVDGILMDGIHESILDLCDQVDIHLLTADTNGTGAEIASVLGVKYCILKPGKEREQKVEYIRKLGVSWVAAIGQGANDELMLKEAALGICVLSPEGTTFSTMLAADLIATDGNAALQLFLRPSRLIGSLRI
jgi:P-type E1-E2 ATPase